jgi:large subunit ribosomal protein L28
MILFYNHLLKIYLTVLGGYALARKCDLCDKKVQYGNQISHSKQHTRREWLPNIQPATITIDGTPKRVNICTRCLRNQHKMAKK